jgi:hypothetical protein
MGLRQRSWTSQKVGKWGIGSVFEVAETRLAAGSDYIMFLTFADIVSIDFSGNGEHITVYGTPIGLKKRSGR